MSSAASPVSVRETGQRRSSSYGISDEKLHFSAVTSLVLGSVNSCWLQLSWQVTLPGDLDTAGGDRENEQGKKSAL